jgi:membrane protease YdiL (CAAX protease family)
MSLFPSIFRQDDPFNQWMRRVAPIAVLILLPVVVMVQQFSVSLLGQSSETAPPELVRDEDADPPGVQELAVYSKVIVKSIHDAIAQEDPSGRSSPRPFGDPQSDGGNTLLPREAAAEAMKTLDEIAASRTDRFRTAIVAGELMGPRETVTRLQRLQHEVSPEGDLAKDIFWIMPWYMKAAEGRIDRLPEGVQESIRARHGWFGELALTHQQPSSDPLRQWVIGGGERLRTIGALEGLWRGGGLVAGLVLAITALVKMRGHELSVPETNVDRFLYIETFALFVLGFVFLGGVGLLVVGQTSGWAFAATEVLQWLAVCAVFWPLARGVTGEELRIDLGLHAGEGVGKEIGIGFLGYLAGVPFVIIGTLVVILISGGFGDTPEEGGHRFPVFGAPLSGSWVPVIFGAIGACVWAPFFEECFFRGCLHRYLPFRMGVWMRILISSALFGIIHPYDAQGMIQVGLGGVVFGYLREWRGTLIPSITAHFLHNATITGFNVWVLAAVD